MSDNLIKKILRIFHTEQSTYSLDDFSLDDFSSDDFSSDDFSSDDFSDSDIVYKDYRKVLDVDEDYKHHNHIRNCNEPRKLNDN